jgi:hypothetical protein
VNMQEAPSSRTVQLLESIRESSRAQRYLDLEHYMHWNRHLLAYIGNVTGARLLISTSTMQYNLHFPYFISPNVVDQKSGASDPWPVTPALLLLNSFPPSPRPALLTQAAEHAPGVWILRSAKDKDLTSDLPELQRVRAVKLVDCAQGWLLGRGALGYLPYALQGPTMVYFSSLDS